MLRSDAAALEALTRAIADLKIDRLVLLGDVVELRQGPARDALAAAEPVLWAVGAALPAGSRVTIVAGNHDHGLLGPWLTKRSRDGAPEPLALENVVTVEAGEPLARIVRWLTRSATSVTVDVAYPGCWVRDDVYAMHGHYSDRHATVPMLERLGAGAMARVVGEATGGPAGADDYEAVLGPLYAWLDALAAAESPHLARRPGAGLSVAAWRTLVGGAGGTRPPGSGIRRRALGAVVRGVRRPLTRAGFRLLVAALDRGGLGPLNADLSSEALRRGRLDAVADVVRRLDITAEHVVFGHTHRAGPQPGDDRAEWRGPGGGALINTGCWVRDGALAGGSPADSPYRPGFCVVVDEAPVPPRLVNLLDPL